MMITHAVLWLGIDKKAFFSPLIYHIPSQERELSFKAFSSSLSSKSKVHLKFFCLLSFFSPTLQPSPLSDPSELFWVIFVSVYELKGEEDENGL